MFHEHMHIYKINTIRRKLYALISTTRKSLDSVFFAKVDGKPQNYKLCLRRKLSAGITTRHHRHANNNHAIGVDDDLDAPLQLRVQRLFPVIEVLESQLFLSSAA